VRGDDVKDLDWKASARTGDLLVKRYVAVRRHTVLLVVSTGRSMAAANSLEVSKRDLAVEVAGLVGWLGVRQGDLVGVAHGDASGCHSRPAKSGELHLERCLAAIHHAISPEAAPADLVGLLGYVGRTVRRRAIVLVVCDEEEATPELVTLLRRLEAQHEVMVVTVGDIDPVAVPATAPAALDLESGQALPSWLRGDPLLREELHTRREQSRRSFHQGMAAAGVAHEHVAESASALMAVRHLLARNRHARRR
jgi:uncharacterized protein (DUF58 family)